jgi:hypothetical protein
VRLEQQLQQMERIPAIASAVHADTERDLAARTAELAARAADAEQLRADGRRLAADCDKLRERAAEAERAAETSRVQMLRAQRQAQEERDRAAAASMDGSAAHVQEVAEVCLCDAIPGGGGAV